MEVDDDGEAYQVHVLPRLFQCLHCLHVHDVLQILAIHRDNLVPQSTPIHKHRDRERK